MQSKSGKTILFIILFLLFKPAISFSLSLEEAISLSRKNLPSYKASKISVESKKALYDASLSPYLPSLDASGTKEHLNTTSEGYDINGYNLSLSYTLFDGGKRKSDRNIARLNLYSSREEFRKNLINLEYDAKVMYFTVVARKEILEQRELQIKDAQKDYEIANGKHQYGAALRSDVLQASVRLKQSLFDSRLSEGEFAKALFDLNSFLGRPLGTAYDLEEFLDTDIKLPEKDSLARFALETPVSIQAENFVEISKNNLSLSKSNFYPTFYFDLSYADTETCKEYGDKSTENKSAAVIANWNIFKWDKFYQKKSSRRDMEVSRENLKDVKRRLILEVHKAYEDLLTAQENLKLANQQLEEARFNYDQALGEYKEGKGDILSLVRAENLLADSRTRMSISRLDFAVSKAALEQAAGIETLQTIKKVSIP